MRRALVVLALAVGGALPGAAWGASPPPGATAHCRDGSYSYSQHHSGTCSYHGGVASWLDGHGSTPSASSSSSSAASSNASSTTPISIGHTVLLARRTRTSGCRRDARPDRRCSPGAYYSALTKAVICSPSFRTSTIRNVPESVKFQVEREYGMAARLYGRIIEIDHIVSLELGGSNDISNLYPEPGSGPANYRLKDKVENATAGLVCAGKMNLRTAQRAIASDWEVLYQRVFGSAPSG